jgi:hypothetical protein
MQVEQMGSTSEKVEVVVVVVVVVDMVDMVDMVGDGGGPPRSLYRATHREEFAYRQCTGPNRSGVSES